MDGHDIDSNESPMELVGPVSAQEIARWFKSHSDLTYRRLEHLTVADASVFQSLLTGSLIRDCDFADVNFSRSDLDGLRAEGTRFTRCDFTHCDIRSSFFSRCTFDACVFDSSLIEDCELRETEFGDCGFASAQLSRNRFYESSLSRCKLTPGTLLHNKLYQCAISDMVLGDCTILYLILRDCVLTRVSINTESIGSIFGLTRQQLSAADFVYLGQKLLVPDESDRLGLIYEEYRKRKWHLGELVMAVNFGLSSTIAAFNSYCSKTLLRFTELGFAKGEELEFIGDLLQELAALKRLPLLSLLNTIDWCANVEAAIAGSTTPSQGSVNSVRTLASRAVLLANQLLDDLDDSVFGLELENPDVPVYLRATFTRRPSLSLHEQINSITRGAQLGVGETASLVSIKEGSYVEIVLATLLSVLAFQVFLFLINGCVIQLTELKHRLNVLARKRAPKVYQEQALVPVQHASPLLLSALGALKHYANGLDWLKSADPSLSGLAASNLESLELLDEQQSKD